MASCWLNLIIFVVLNITKGQTGKWNWNTVMIGGGGEIEGLHFSVNGNLYARTDVGGCYRYIWENEYWLNLLDWLPASMEGYFSTDALTSSPHEPSTLFAALGSGQPADIWKSTDNGTTWTQTNIGNGSLIGGGNQNDRWGGYRLIVHPNPSMKNTIYFGSRQQGLWRNDVGGGNNQWYKVDSFPNIDFQNDTNNAGIVYVNINPFNYNIYASVVDYGIYLSTDNSKTWSKITDSDFNLTNSLRSVFNPKLNDGLFYASDVNLGLFVYDEKNERWSNIAPTNTNHQFHGIDISPDGKWFVLSQHAYGSSNLYYASYVSSLNASNWNWIRLKGSNYDNRQNDIPWMTYDMFASMPSAFIFNLNDYNKDPTKLSVIMSTIVVWMNKDITNGSATPWYTTMHGFEEVCFLDMACPSSGNISYISALADVEGFMHSNVYEYPKQRFYFANDSAEGAIDTSGIDFCEKDPMIVVRVPGNGYNDGAQDANASITTDQGKTWNKLQSHPPYITTNGYTWPYIGGQIRIAPDNCDHMVWIPLFNFPYVTKDGGKTWTNSTGAPQGVTGYLWEWEGANWHQWANDRVNGNYWYIYWYTNIYVSSNGGYTWNITTNVGWEDGCQPLVKTDFGQEGHVCVALGNNGLKCSMDHGNTFKSMQNVNISRLVGWGRSKNDPKKSIMYYFGISQEDKDKGVDVQSPYQIDANGNHIKMNTNSSYMLGDGPHLLRGDRQIYGRIYIGSEGRGAYFSEFVET